MICTPSTSPFKAVIDKADSDKCNNSADYVTNTCRNIITLNEILNGAYVGDMTGFEPQWGVGAEEQDSKKIREHCLRNAMGIPLDGSVTNDTWNIRDWKKDVAAE